MTTLVMLPGLDGTGLLFDEFAAAIRPAATLIIGSYPTSRALGYEELEPIARAFLPKDEPYFLLAESFSGPLAISIAASNPPGLQGLILCCSFASNPQPLLRPFRSVLGVLPLHLVPTALLSHFLLGRFANEQRRAALAAAIRKVVSPALAARAKAVLSVDVSGQLPRIGVPVLYLRATEDRVVPMLSAEQIKAGVKSLTIAEFGAPHFLLQVMPEAVALRVREWMMAGDSWLGAPGAGLAGDDPRSSSS